MKLVDKKNVYQWFFIYGFLLALCVGCGQEKGSNALDGLDLSLQIPEGEQPDLFWYGVESRALRITRDGREPTEWNWQPGKALELDLREGDRLQFFGFDSKKRVLIEGQAEVTEEKKVSIPVHRVL